MKSFVALALLCCVCSSLPQLVAQTKKDQSPPYTDTDGYQVLSAIIKARTEKSGAGSVPIFYQTVSGGTNGEIMAECSSRFPEEFQSALAHLNRMTKKKFVLQRQFSIHKEYKLVETMVACIPEFTRCLQ